MTNQTKPDSAAPSAQMQFIGELNGTKLYFAGDGFSSPGVYIWDGNYNVQVWPKPENKKYGWGAPDSGPGEQSDMATAWLAVVEVLNEVVPKWIEGRGTGIECAIEAIRNLSAQPDSAAPGGDVEQRAIELLALAERGPANEYGFVHRRIAHQAIIAALSAPKQVEDDADRIDWLESMANKPGGLLLHDGTETGRTGIGLRPGFVRRTLRQAIDAASSPQPAPQPVEAEGREVAQRLTISQPLSYPGDA